MVTDICPCCPVSVVSVPRFSVMAAVISSCCAVMADNVPRFSVMASANWSCWERRVVWLVLMVWLVLSRFAEMPSVCLLISIPTFWMSVLRLVSTEWMSSVLPVIR